MDDSTRENWKTVIFKTRNVLMADRLRNSGLQKIFHFPLHISSSSSISERIILNDYKWPVHSRCNYANDAY